MKNCIDEGTLQAWFDGELAANEAANVTAHLNSCAHCAAAATTAEAESLILSEALATEFAAPVPTERLRERIDTAVAGLHRANVHESNESRWRAIAEFFAFRPFAYASVAAIILLAGVIGFVYLKNKPSTSVAINDKTPAIAPSPKQTSDDVARKPDEGITPLPSHTPENQVVRSVKLVRRFKPVEPDATSPKWQEHQYQYAIAKLNEAIKTQPPMRPALQVEYAYNMALIDSAIATTREAAKKNPKDPLTNQFMLAAYQSKVDFMNQIADAQGLEK
jgi:Putative zinc-finger